MMVEDSVHYMRGSEADAKLSDARMNEYTTLLSEIHRGLIVTNGDAIRFHVAGGGLSAIGPEWSKGIEYQPESPEGIIVESLDRPASLAVGNVYLHQLAPHWFIFENLD